MIFKLPTEIESLSKSIEALDGLCQDFKWLTWELQ